MKKIFISLLAVLLFTPAFTGAVSLVAEEEYTLQEDEIIEGNLYAAYGSGLITGDIEGDIVTAGGNVLITGDVGDDALIAGGNVTLTGDISGDVRVVGGTVVSTGSIDGDLLAGSGRLIVVPGSEISGALIAGAGEVILDGVISGDVIIAGEDIRLNGDIEGDVKVEAVRIFIGEEASISGNLSYKGGEPEIAEGASIAGEIIVLEKSVKPSSHIKRIQPGKFLAGLSFMKLLMLLVGGLLIFWLLRKSLTNFVEDGIKQFGKEFLRGIILLIVVPIVSVILFITVIGLPVGFLFLLLYGAFYIFASLLSGIIFGVWSARVIFKKKKYPVNGWSVVLGIIGLHIISLIPVVGWIIDFIFVLVSLGVIWRSAYRLMK